MERSQNTALDGQGSGSLIGCGIARLGAVGYQYPINLFQLEFCRVHLAKISYSPSDSETLSILPLYKNEHGKAPLNFGSLVNGALAQPGVAICSDTSCLELSMTLYCTAVLHLHCASPSIPQPNPA
jgi:hypothetical protein